jgi:hypothetical protein
MNKRRPKYISNRPTGKFSGIIFAILADEVYSYADGGGGGTRPAQDTDIAAKSL